MWPYVYSRQTVLKVTTFLLVFLPLKLLLVWGRKLSKFISGSIFGDSKDANNNKNNSNVNKDELVNVRRIWWSCNPRPLLLCTHINDVSIDVDGGVVKAAEFVWRTRNVFLHHVDEDGISFVRMKEGEEK